MASPAAAGQKRQWWVLAGLLTASFGLSQAWTWWQEREVVRSLQQQVQPGDILIYTTADCPFCARAKRWLTNNQVAWRECPIESNTGCQHSYAQQGSPGVPLLQVRQAWHLGFDPQWVLRTIEARPAPPQARPSRSNEPRP